MVRRFGWLIVALIAVQLESCKGDEPQDPSGEDFDKQAMLEQLADAVILPAYNSLNAEIAAFTSDFESYKSDPSLANANALRAQLDAVSLAWQSCAPFELGPAADRSLKLTVNTFPTDTARVQELFSQTEYDLGNAQNTAAKGFPALEYVLSRPDSTWDLDFIEANLAWVEAPVELVGSDWNSTYRDEFVTSTGSDVGSSLGLLVNALNQDFELVKNAKVGIPLGKKTLGVAQPEKVEALYSGHSISLLRANLVTIRDAFTGGSGSGIDDYLDALDARRGDMLLSEAIEEGFVTCLEGVDAIQVPLNEAIETNPSLVEDLHAKLQNQVVLLKTDMPSQLGVQITYQDNDGD